jgi:CRP-like cAMP-binding protein
MRRTTDYLSSLAELDVLSDCTRAELDGASSLLTRLEVPAGTTLLREDTFGREFLIVADGALSVTRGKGMDTQLLATVGAGEVVGEMALLDRVPRTATVTAITPATVYAGNASEFFSLRMVAPSAARKIDAVARQRAEANRAA